MNAKTALKLITQALKWVEPKYKNKLIIIKQIGGKESTDWYVTARTKPEELHNFLAEFYDRNVILHEITLTTFQTYVPPTEETEEAKPDPDNTLYPEQPDAKDFVV